MQATGPYTHTNSQHQYHDQPAAPAIIIQQIYTTTTKTKQMHWPSQAKSLMPYATAQWEEGSNHGNICIYLL